jgi:hypothetical protein
VTVADTFPNGLRPLQMVGALDIQRDRIKLLADQPGAGKTAQVLFGLELDGMFDRKSVTLILCNVTGCQLTWSPEIRKRLMTQHDLVFADLTDTGMDRQGRQKKTMPSVAARDDKLAEALMDADDQGLPLVILANFNLVEWKFGTPPKMLTLFSTPLDAVVIDEAHLVLPTKKDHPKETTQFWAGLQALAIKPDAFRLAVTGTPDRGKLENRYGHWKFLHPRYHRDYWSWLSVNFNLGREVIGRDPRTGRDRTVVTVRELKHPDQWEQFDRLMMLRRTKKEMLKGLPEKLWAGDDGAIEMRMTPVQRNAYDDQLADMQAEYEELMASDDEKDNQRASGLKMQFALRMRQMATCTWDFVEKDGIRHGVPRVAGLEASNKLAWIHNWLEERGYVKGEGFDPAGGKVVITSYFTEVLYWLQKELEALGIRAEVLSGETNAPEKKRIENEFQNGDLRITLLSGYLGVSINLDAADDMIFIDSVHDPDKMEQAEDRIHRASRNHQVMYWRLCSLDSADGPVIEIIDARFKATRATYDGARGVEFARQMLGLTKHPELEIAS